MHNISVIQGDGIGPEIIKSLKQVFFASGVKIKWRNLDAGLSAIKKNGISLPSNTIDSIKSDKVAIKGPTTTPIGKGHKSINVELRQKLNLYACIRPIKSLPKISNYQNVDLVIIRENTEGLYAGKEIIVDKNCIISLKISTKKACDKIVKKSFKYIKQNNRQKLTSLHKANIIKMGDGLFLECARKEAKKNKNIIYEEQIIDAACMNLVSKPDSFDVLVMENLYGDIVSDLCAGLIGGLGLIPSANIGDQYAIFEAVHGSAPDIANNNIANPTAIIKSGLMLLRHIEEHKVADSIESAVNYVLMEKKNWTYDLGGKINTDEFTNLIIKQL